LGIVPAMSGKKLNVAVVGAGMGGLAAAACLRKAGIDVAVYEQARQFTRLGAGIQIGCNAMHVLRGLGLEPRLRAETFYPRSWNNRDWKSARCCSTCCSASRPRRNTARRPAGPSRRPACPRWAAPCPTTWSSSIIG